jgi:hypothetical protein
VTTGIRNETGLKIAFAVTASNHRNGATNRTNNEILLAMMPACGLFLTTTVRI